MQIDNLHTLSISIFIIICLWLWILFVWNYLRREKLKQKYQLLFDQHKSFYLRYISLICAVIFTAISLFEIHSYSNTSSQKESIDVVFVLDVSKSMNTQDLNDSSLSRIEYAQSQLQDYILNAPDNRYALVIFAGDSISISPLSHNIENIINNIARVDYRNIAKQWTDIQTALELWYKRFEISENNTGKALILISDGWDEDTQIDTQAIKDINTNKIPSFIFGVWSSAGGKIPLWVDRFWKTIYQSYQWNTVITKLNDRFLKNVAENIGGHYNSLVDFWDQLDEIKTSAIYSSWDRYKHDISWKIAIIIALLYIIYLVFPYLPTWKK